MNHLIRICLYIVAKKSWKLPLDVGGNPEQLNAKPWLKVCPLTASFPHWGAVVFQTRSSVQCDPSAALLHGLLTSVQPSGSDLCPGKSISAFCHGWRRCGVVVKWHKLLRGSCALIMNVSVSQSYRVCLLFVCHGWRACVFQVNVLSATFVPAGTYQCLYCTCTVLSYICSALKQICARRVAYFLAYFWPTVFVISTPLPYMKVNRSSMTKLYL